MAIHKLVFCLASLIVLNVSPACCAPQGFMNFGWPAQQDYNQRLPAQAFTPTETAPIPAPAMAGLWSPPVPEVAEPLNRQTVTVVQPPKLHKKFPVPQSRLSNGSASRLSKQQTSKKSTQSHSF